MNIKFWAKTDKENNPTTSVYEHLINVGCVAQRMAEMCPELLERFNLDGDVVAASAGIHDIGKITPGFQRKCPQWLVDNNLADIDTLNHWESTTEPSHGAVSQIAIQTFLTENGISPAVAMNIGAALGGHHGRIKLPPQRNPLRYGLSSRISEPCSGIDWNGERTRHAQAVWDYFNSPQLNLDPQSPAIWWLAGLSTIADWIGSDERFFTPESGAVHAPENSAELALDTIGFSAPIIRHGLSFHDKFGFSPNNLQLTAMDTITRPGVYVIEAPMGMGKTEAALAVAYQLMTAGHARGIYFALPTQATSNRIHLRLNEFLNRITDNGNSRLIHSNSWLMDSAVVNYSNEQRDWFATSKKALLAPFGVGTIDQALLGVVAAKHFFVRHYALAGKVVILDEVHSYDIYTGTLIDKLVMTLEALGCTVIILSATLTGKRRDQIISVESNGTDEPYPLITGRAETLPIEPQAIVPPKPVTTKVTFIDLNFRSCQNRVKHCNY